MYNFNNERLMLTQQAVTLAEVAFLEALEWSRERKTFGKVGPLSLNEISFYFTSLLHSLIKGLSLSLRSHSVLRPSFTL